MRQIELSEVKAKVQGKAVLRRTDEKSPRNREVVKSKGVRNRK